MMSDREMKEYIVKMKYGMEIGYGQELVRCKDCKYYNTEKCADGFGWCNRNGTGHGSTADWFCADGEKK